MGAFQTLREEGLLPLATVRDSGSDGSRSEEEEYVEDIAHEDCGLYTIDVNWANTSDTDPIPRKVSTCMSMYPSSSSPSTTRTRTSTYVGEEGLVAMKRTNVKPKPLILLANMSELPDEKWMGMFNALGEGVEYVPWSSVVGACFRRLYIGKSNTLNFYRTFDEDAEEFERALKTRQRALNAFSGVMKTAEEAKRKKQGKQRWRGYGNEELEVLRKGIISKDIDKLQVLRELRMNVIDQEESLLEVSDREEIHRLRKQEAKETRAVIQERLQRSMPGQSVSTSSSTATNATMLVVTYMHRPGFKRSVLNEADILEYILSVYSNVTLRVTSFEEPLMEVMQLLSSTDVLIGMHGQGWTNAVFKKPGGAALQLHPFGWEAEFHEGAIVHPVRGVTYKNIVDARNSSYMGWVNGVGMHAVMRPKDFRLMNRKGKAPAYNYTVHPQPEWPRPVPHDPGPHWINQCTVVGMRGFADVLDALFEAAGRK